MFMKDALRSHGGPETPSRGGNRGRHLHPALMGPFLKLPLRPDPLLCATHSEHFKCPSGLCLPSWALAHPETIKSCAASFPHFPPPTPTVPPPRQADIKMGGSPSPAAPRPLPCPARGSSQGVDAGCLLVSPPPSLGWAGDHLSGRDPDHHRLHAGGLHHAGL